MYHGMPAAAKRSVAEARRRAASHRGRRASDARAGPSAGCAEATSHGPRRVGVAAASSRLAPASDTATSSAARRREAIVAVQRMTSVLAFDRRRQIAVVGRIGVDRRRPPGCRRSSGHPAPPPRAGIVAPVLDGADRGEVAGRADGDHDSDVGAAVVDHGDLVDEPVGRRPPRPLDADRRVGDRVAACCVTAPTKRALPPSSSRWPTGAGSTPSTATTSSARWRTSAWNSPCAPWPRSWPSAPDSTHVGARDAGDQLVQERLRHGLQSSRSRGLSFKCCGQGV